MGFQFRPELEGQIPTEDYSPGVTKLPKPFHLRLSCRI